MHYLANTERRRGRMFHALAVALPLTAAGCSGLPSNDQGALQPQTVRGPCQVKKFFLLSQTAVHTDMTVDNAGQPCTFTVLNPDLQAFPTASLITEQPAHGRAESGLTNGGRSPIVSYTPQPGYSGTDRFTVTIEPNDHAIAVAVTVTVK
jgi:hypothetical protein